MAQGFKTGGRKKGTPNKVTAQVKQQLADFCGQSLQILLDNPQNLDRATRLDLLVKLLPYVVPKPTDDTQPTPATFAGMEYNKHGQIIGLKIGNVDTAEKSNAKSEADDTDGWDFEME